jgi:hypothetical protein
MSVTVAPPERRKNGDISADVRAGIVACLLSQATDLKLPRGAIQTTATRFRCSTKAVSRLWSASVTSMQTTGMLPDFSLDGRSRTGRKKKAIDLQAKIKEVPLRRRQTLRSLSAALDVPMTTVFRSLKEGEIKRHSSSVKPLLTDVNRRERLDFCLSFVDASTMMFHGISNRIHVDEKWFYITKCDRTYYLAADEEPPHRSVKSKRYVTKVMFLAAVMRPIIISGEVLFDGKLGIWPFVSEEPAQRTSKNRAAGTIEIKPVSVDRDTYRAMLIENVIPAIKQKVPWLKSTKLVIQQDGAGAHVADNDPAVLSACGDGGWTISLAKQPPNSPDLNILDLGFFCSIQSLQHTSAPASIAELIECTENAFAALDAEKLDDTFLSLQQVMEAILRDFGNNQYKRPHMAKQKLRRQGLLPLQLLCCESVYLAALAFQFLSDL